MQLHIKKRLLQIREFFWPVLDEFSSNTNFKILGSKFTLTKPEDISIAYSLAIKYYENEEKRRSIVEGKAFVFIGTVGLAITILMFVVKEATSINNFVGHIQFFLLCLIIIYLCRVAWFAVDALKVGEYSSIGYSDIISCDLNYQKSIILKLINYTKINFDITNLKVDSLNMAQSYFRRAIVTVGIYVILIFFQIINFNYLLLYFRDGVIMEWVDVVYKVATILIAAIVAYCGYKYNNNIKNMQIMNNRMIKEQYYHKLVECCIKYFSYMQSTNTEISASLEATKYNMEFCIEISRLPLYASKDIINYLSKCQNKEEQLNLTYLDYLILNDLASNQYNCDKLDEECGIKQNSTAITPNNVIVTIDGKENVLNKDKI